MAEFPVTKPQFIVPSCVNLSTYIQGMSDYEVRCYYTQLVQQWATEWSQMQTEWGTQQEAFESFKQYVNDKLQTFQDWFDNLDVQREINNKIDEMVSDGTFLTIIQSTVNSQTQTAADAWLQENMTPGAGAPALDSSLTLANAAAQSKAVGDALATKLSFASPSTPLGTTFGSLDPRKTYLLFGRDIAAFTDVDQSVKDVITSPNNFALLSAIWANSRTMYSGYTLKYLLFVPRSNNIVDVYTLYTSGDPKTLKLGNKINIDVDDTLSIAGEAADAQAVGDALRNVHDSIADIRDSIANISVEAPSELVSPNGTKFTLLVSDSGVISTTPNTPNIAEFVGNSLLLGFNFQSGMAADHYYNDYFHRLKNTYARDATWNKQSGTSLEGSTSTSIFQNAATTIISNMDESAQLVMYQLGDNCNSTTTQNTFTSNLEWLFKQTKQHCPNARLAFAYGWYTKGSEFLESIKRACKNQGVIFIDFTSETTTHYSNSVGNVCTLETAVSTSYNVDSFELGENNTVTIHFTVDEQQYSSTMHYDSYTSSAGIQITVTGAEIAIVASGVASHPSDKGFEQIANQMAKSLNF